MIVKQALSILFLLCVLAVSCTKRPSQTSLPEGKEDLEVDVDLNELQIDFMKWWTYHTHHIHLSSNFRGLDENADTLEKKLFLEQLISSHYLPIQVKSGDSVDTYQLVKMGAADGNIQKTIKNESLTQLKHLNMEGTPVPSFEFPDLHGKVYNTENTKGKTLILKTWFTSCKACIAEFPELNEFVGKYLHRKDIIFVSVATNTAAELESFLAKRRFEYEVIPNQGDFIGQELDLQIYPTHIVIDKDGIVLKVVNKASEMMAFVDNMMEDESSEK
ncbi:MAG: TlpA disulfide reductase family protein [Bacteroidota bacterium]